jgi:hypothetical protein
MEYSLANLKNFIPQVSDKVRHVIIEELIKWNRNRTFVMNHTIFVCSLLDNQILKTKLSR